MSIATYGNATVGDVPGRLGGLDSARQGRRCAGVAGAGSLDALREDEERRVVVGD